MRPKFNERKTAQLSAYFMSKSEGDMYLLKLVKLLYLADRQAFADLGRPITMDSYVSMDHGPVLSRTYNLMTGSVMSEGSWVSTISPRDNNKLKISDSSEVTYDDLSEIELEIADRVFGEFGHIPRFELAEWTHRLEEWQDPQGSSTPITYAQILRAVGHSEDDVDALLESVREQSEIDELLTKR